MALLGGRWKLGEARSAVPPVLAYRGHDGTSDAMVWISEELSPHEELWRNLPAPWARLIDVQPLDGSLLLVHEYVPGVSLNAMYRALSRFNTSVPLTVAAELGAAFLRACLALGDDRRARVLAATIDPSSVILDWQGQWRFCRGGLIRDAVWRRPALRESAQSIAALLVRHALFGDTYAEGVPVMPSRLADGGEPLRTVLRPYLAPLSIGAGSPRELLQQLEALTLEGPSPEKWRAAAVGEYFERERRRDDEELRRLLGLTTTVLPLHIDQRLQLDDSDESYLVASDWLMTNEPHRGALAEVQRAAARGGDVAMLRARERELFNRYDELSPEPVLEQSWQWREGWLDSIVVRRPPDSAADIERTLLHPSARYLRSLFVAGGVGGNPLVVEALEQVKPRSLRRVHLSAGGPSLAERIRAALPWVTDVVAPEVVDRGREWIEFWPPLALR